MLLSEALDAVNSMLGGYPNRSQAGDTYIGTMAKIMMNYPRAIAARCADPLRGVAVTTKFLPTAADITEWCDRETLPLAKSAERDDRLREQFGATMSQMPPSLPVGTSIDGYVLDAVQRSRVGALTYLATAPDGSRVEVTTYAPECFPSALVRERSLRELRWPHSGGGRDE